MLIKNPLLIAPLALMLACASDATVGPGDSGPNGEPGGGGGDDVTTSTQLSGTYEVTSSYNLAENSELPAIVSDVVVPLSNLAENPTGTIIDLVKSTNTPAATALNAIPGPLLSIFESTMNNLIEDKLYENVPVLEQITSYTDLVAGMLVHFEVVTQLEVGAADEAGNAEATHTLLGLTFDNNGTENFVNTPELLDTLTVAKNISVHAEFSGVTSSIDIGDHGMHLPLGEFAVYGLNTAIAATSDFDDLGDALGGLVNCESIAAQIGDLCLSFVCVANESQLQSICETGLNLVAQQVENRIKDIDVAELQMSSGQADLRATSKTDSTQGNEVSAFKAGSWTSIFHFGNYELSTNASFEAKRVN
jgi:hypothetical protein